MSDSGTLMEKGRTELEELYLGLPDDSVNLSFHDLEDVTQNTKPSEKKKPTTMEAIPEAKPTKGATPLIKLPSLDFSKALEASRQHNFDHVKRDMSSTITGDMYGRHAFHNYRGEDQSLHATPGHRHQHASTNGHSELGHVADVDGRSMNGHDDVSGLGMASMYQERGRGRSRPGIPHSNICTTYIYILRHRCLVCGRVYCRQCVGMGMGEMTEGRKCIECLGRRFSQRYIERAGKTGCCFGYPSLVKQAELKWAEKGPRRSGERAYGHVQGCSVMMSPRPRSPMTPRAHHADSNPPSFVMSTSFSPYTPTHHHLPL